MLISKWNHTSAEMWQYLYSLQALKNVHVKIFECPRTLLSLWFVFFDVLIVTAMLGTNQVPFTRVNHAKFMVTENIAYISTQNWYGFLHNTYH